MDESDKMNFIILSNQRSGTKLLRSYLKNHPSLSIGSEIFLNKNENEKREIIEKHRPTNKTNGCIIQYNQLTPLVINYIRNRKVIQLIRTDLVRMYSLFEAHYKIVSERPFRVEIDISRAYQYAKSVLKNIKKYRNLAGLTVFFKDILPINNILGVTARKRLLNFLEVKDLLLEPSTEIQHKFKLDKVAINHKEAIKKFKPLKLEYNNIK